MDFGFTTAAYVVAAVLFILSLGGLSGQESAKRAVWYGITGMALAVFATLIGPGSGLWFLSLVLIGAGGVIGYMLASKVEMTQMPELVAGMHALVGLAAVLVGFNAHIELGRVLAMDEGARKSLEGFAALLAKKDSIEINILRVEVFLGVFIGAVTFTGSVIAYGKLSGKVSSAATKLPGGHLLNIGAAAVSLLCLFWYLGAGGMLPLVLMTLAALFIGYHLIMGIGGADMPVIISLLNSYSGVAAAATGFVLMNNGLIISGALVGASGLILTNIMCKGMNRSLANVIFGAVGLEQESITGSEKQMKVKSTTTEEAAMILEAADKVIIVPGYGLAVAQAQHAVREVADLLESMGKKVLYAIHPVAGRMPGHMNVLLAEANVPYEQLKDLGDVNPEFDNCDVAIVLGANDVVNPASRHDTSSPIYGMPILDVDKSRTVIVNKRTMNPGFAGIQNELFGFDNTVMVFGDAKEMLTTLYKDLKEL